MRFKTAVGLAVLLLCGAGLALAQSYQTGVLQGNVKDPEGLALPGVTVSVTSPALQGTRSTTTELDGAYIFKGLPPGAYTVLFELASFASLERTVSVPLGGTAVADAQLRIAALEEVVQVTAEPPSVLATTQVGANYRGDQIDKLATGRTLATIAELAPGLTNNTPNAGQVTIAGSFAYDNVFLVNGVDVNDNLFGNANNLFIEDAIEEVQVLTSGVSSEYGRFSGGVINAVTKRGGNQFSGSFRTDFTNPSWTARTPFERERGITRQDETQKVHQATLGGPIVKDRLWFFLAGRSQKTSTDQPYPETGLPGGGTTTDNKRFEAKLTGTLTPNHTLQGSYIRNSSDVSRPTFPFTIDPAARETPSFPNDLFVFSYNGVLSANLFLEAQYSQKKFEFEGSGGSDPDIVNSPFITATQALGHYNAPYFDATDPEARNNKQFSSALSYFLGTEHLGRHDVKAGFEWYRSTNTGGNSQSATGYVFDADYLTDLDGSPALDASGRLQPVFEPGVTVIENWLAVRGARIDITTSSFFVNDKWQLDEHWRFNLGLRYERVRSEATGNIVGVDTDTLVPRLAATFDPKGDGAFRFGATYGHYAGKYSESQFAGNTNVGNPDRTLGIYVGPPGVGRGFAPGFDPANYITFLGVFPTANVAFDSSLSSPVTKEFTLQAGARLGSRGEATLTFTQRKVGDFVEDFIDTTTGETQVVRDGIDYGTFTNSVYRNTNLPERKYQGLQLQVDYRPRDRLSLSGHYTYQIKNEGNFEGEASNQPAISSPIGDYPELYVATRNFPYGRLSGFQRHKLRLWSIYRLGLGRAGNLDVGGLWRYDSAQVFDYVATDQPFSDVQLARDPGYASLPQLQDIYFGARGAGEFAGSHAFDLALNYELPLYKSARPWFKVELLNALDNDKRIAWNTTIRPDFDGPLDADGIPTTYIQGRSFGQGTSNAHYPTARTFRFSLGFRF
jgi:outer membrane receptor for ferrienterochelin and colicin